MFGLDLIKLYAVIMHGSDGSDGSDECPDISALQWFGRCDPQVLDLGRARYVCMGLNIWAQLPL